MNFPNILLKKEPTVYNTIQKFRDTRVHDESDAAIILSYFMKLHEEDPEYIIIPRLEGTSNELIGLFWMTS